MKRLLPFWIIYFLAIGFVILSIPVSAQYYFTGTTFLKENQPAPYVKMRLHSTGALFRSGATGDFGIPSRYKTDTVTCWNDKTDTLVVALTGDSPNMLMMKEKAFLSKARDERGRLSNLTPHLITNVEQYYSGIGETYAALVENQFVNTISHTTTGFSPNSNKASYANIRRFLDNNTQVNPNAVRIEEMINYFSLNCAPNPPPDKTFSIQSRLTDCPWNTQSKLLFVNAQAKTLDFSKIPPANLVFLIDNSGSMDMPNRMPLLKSAFSMLVNTLRDIDRVAIVTYGGAAGIWLPPTSGSYKDSILKSIQSIEVGGATAGSNGIQLAYNLARVNPVPDANNRVILATDGDFNVGLTAETELEEMIIRQRKTGVKLTCLGVGMGNFKDSKIETLARHGNGNYAYLDSEQEAAKVLVSELSESLFSVASDVTIHVKLDPRMVKRYKLIGYENRRTAINDENSFLVGGDIGSGFSLNTMLEVELADTSVAFLTKNYNRPIGELMIQYKIPGNDSMNKTDLHRFVINYQPMEETDRAIRLTTAITMFGQLLRKSEAAANINLLEVLDLATNSFDPTKWQESQLIELIKKAQTLYITVEPGKRKDKRKRKSD
jgi:Ca-activated chloride channel family protein